MLKHQNNMTCNFMTCVSKNKFYRPNKGNKYQILPPNSVVPNKIPDNVKKNSISMLPEKPNFKLKIDKQDHWHQHNCTNQKHKTVLYN